MYYRAAQPCPCCYYSAFYIFLRGLTSPWFREAVSLVRVDSIFTGKIEHGVDE